MNVARRLIAGALVGLGVTLLVIVGGLLPRGLSGREVPVLASLVGTGFALIGLVLLLSWLASRWAGHELSGGSLVLLGVVAGSAATLAIAYALEGFEFGVGPLVSDPVSWIWLAGFCLGGASLGWMWGSARLRKV